MNGAIAVDSANDRPCLAGTAILLFVPSLAVLVGACVEGGTGAARASGARQRGRLGEGGTCFDDARRETLGENELDALFAVGAPIAVGGELLLADAAVASPGVPQRY